MGLLVRLFLCGLAVSWWSVCKMSISLYVRYCCIVGMESIKAYGLGTLLIFEETLANPPDPILILHIIPLINHVLT